MSGASDNHAAVVIEGRRRAAAVRRSVVPAGLSLLVLSVAIVELHNADFGFYLGRDFELYRDAAANWLSGGYFYQPYQLAGPYAVEHGAILYPPTIIFLLAPFIIVPAWLWWAVPLSLTSWCLIRLSPRPIAWPVISLLVVFPNTLIKIMTGNPVIWVLMFVSLGTVYYWPAAFAMLKPTLAPAALFGAWKRSWWIAALVFGALTLALSSLVGQYVVAALNARTPDGIFYSVGEVPMLLIPVTAWFARRRSTHTFALRAG